MLRGLGAQGPWWLRGLGAPSRPRASFPFMGAPIYISYVYLSLNTSFWPQGLGGSGALVPFEPDFGTLAACPRAIKIFFWDHWGTALLGQILARSLLGQILGFWWLGALQLKLPSGILGKRLFWTKSWPGAFWKQICAL